MAKWISFLVYICKEDRHSSTVYYTHTYTHCDTQTKKHILFNAEILSSHIKRRDATPGRIRGALMKIVRTYCLGRRISEKESY